MDADEVFSSPECIERIKRHDALFRGKIDGQQTAEKTREDTAAILAVRDRAVAGLADQYRQLEAAEPGRKLSLVLPGGILRGGFRMELRRWGGKWLPGVAHWMNKLKNPVHASRLVLDGRTLNGNAKAARTRPRDHSFDVALGATGRGVRGSGYPRRAGQQDRAQGPRLQLDHVHVRNASRPGLKVAGSKGLHLFRSLPSADTLFTSSSMNLKRSRPHRRWLKRSLRVGLACVLAAVPSAPALGCSTILTGRGATTDGSVMMSHSCDGDVMGLVYVMPARTYPPGTRLPMYWNVPRPSTYAEYQDNLRKGYDHVGTLPVSETFRSLILAGNLESMTTGGLNEHGLCIAIEFLPMRPGLACSRGRVGPNSNHWTTSLIANGLLRARTAREAIRLIGAMIEEHGFLYYRAPGAGVALPIADGREAWLMEIYGPGEGWKPESGRPGGVWCAQRIPDGEAGCSANRSRIGAVNLNDPEHFLASTNLFSLAEELGFWKPGTPFVWHDVYGGPGDRSNSLREWRALSLAAPALGLKFTGDPQADRYPFSVKPDRPLTVSRLIAVMRDTYEGTEFDVTSRPAFQVEAGRSPLACPWGPPELFELLELKPERAICTPTSGYVFVAQLRADLPAAIGNVLWFAYGPADTSCFMPLYAGVTDLPDAWDHPANFTRIDRQQPQWNFRLVHNLTHRLPYRKVIQSVRQMIHPAERNYVELQPRLEQAALQVMRTKGLKAAEAFLTAYASDCTTQVGFAYATLVDDLMYRFLVGAPELERSAPPRIAAPAVPDAERLQ